MTDTDNETEPTMNDRLRGKPPKYDVFAKYRVEDTTDTTDTGTTDPKETDQ
jgi:hypothetical protein